MVHGEVSVVQGDGMHVLTRLLREQPLGALGALVLLTMAFLAICAPFFAPFDPTQGDATALNSPPNAKYWLGTDAFGRDNLSRLIFGSRISLLVGVGASLLGVVTGAALGIVATYRGGWLDVITQRLMDAMLAFPMLLLALTMAAVLGPSLPNVLVCWCSRHLPLLRRLAPLVAATCASCLGIFCPILFLLSW